MRLLLAIFLSLCTGPLWAQEKATLVADHIFLGGDEKLTAEGSVEIFYQGTRLTASRIVYDSAADSLSIDGPITLDDGRGATVLASSAELSRDMAQGILKSARLVFENRLQIAAVEMTRVSGRYNQLSRVVASSCKVCANSPIPLWEIRARRVIQDQVERQLYFDHAQFPHQHRAGSGHQVTLFHCHRG